MQNGAIEYRFDADETYARGYPCMHEVGPYDDRIIGYDTVLLDGNTVWGCAVSGVRFAHRMTVSAAAEAMSVMPSTIRRWEDGKCIPATTDEARRYCAALLTAAAGVRAGRGDAAIRAA